MNGGENMIIRPRRLRKNETIRSMVAETAVNPDSLVYPMFVVEGEKVKEPIPSMPGQFRFSIDEILKELESCVALGLKSILLFGIPSYKDEMASSAYDDDGIVQRAVRSIKTKFPDLYVITDVCLCEYMSHGHCGIVKEDGDVDNDPTLELLAKTALSHAEAGADMVAPSDMMDGRVAAIREKLDENGYQNLPIMAYSAKFASAYYGPFRDAADSAPHFGNRKSYQMDVRNGREALREVELDIEEGADIVMVKPGLAFLDVLRQTAEMSCVPVAVYNVSGEYSMVKAAALAGWIDENAIIRENLLAFKRAGADIIITYHAKEALEKGLLK
jgi:porphobilinogen synthase